MTLRKQMLFAIASGLLVAISFPTVLFGWKLPAMGITGWVALVPLFMALAQHHNGAGLSGVSPRRAWGLAFVCGLSWFPISIFWVWNAMHTYGGLGIVPSTAVTLLLVLILSSYIALAPWLAVVLKRFAGGYLVLWMPVAWVLVEFLRDHVPFGGFPWANIAMSQAEWPALIQIADLTGVYGVMFAMIFVNQCLAETILSFFQGKKRQALIVASSAGVALAVILVYGGYQLKRLPQQWAHEPSLKVGIIQGNVSQEVKWDPRRARTILSLYREETLRLAKAGTELIIWPEAAYPFTLKKDAPAINPFALGLELFSGENEIPMTLLGAVSEDEGDIYNSAFLFNRFGETQGIYHKTRLVPYGEFVPLEKIFFFAKKLVAPVGHFIPGSSFEPLPLGKALVGPLICYEDVFPEIARKLTAAGSHVLVNITNDAWYGWTSAAAQHVALSVFRAVENRRFLVRSTNTGISAIIDPVGHVLHPSPLFERVVGVHSVHLRSEKSIYTRLGDWLVWGCIAYIAVGLGTCFVKKP